MPSEVLFDARLPGAIRTLSTVCSSSERGGSAATGSTYATYRHDHLCAGCDMVARSLLQDPLRFFQGPFDAGDGRGDLVAACSKFS